MSNFFLLLLFFFFCRCCSTTSTAISKKKSFIVSIRNRNSNTYNNRNSNTITTTNRSNFGFGWSFAISFLLNVIDVIASERNRGGTGRLRCGAVVCCRYVVDKIGHHQKNTELLSIKSKKNKWLFVINIIRYIIMCR